MSKFEITVTEVKFGKYRKYRDIFDTFENLMIFSKRAPA